MVNKRCPEQLLGGKRSFHVFVETDLASEMCMPKVKTKKAAAKRFKVLKSGKIKRWKANKRHLLTKKSRTRKNSLKKGIIVDASNMNQVTRCLPNG